MSHLYTDGQPSDEIPRSRLQNSHLFYHQSNNRIGKFPNRSPSPKSSAPIGQVPLPPLPSSQPIKGTSPTSRPEMDTHRVASLSADAELDILNTLIDSENHNEEGSESYDNVSAGSNGAYSSGSGENFTTPESNIKHFNNSQSGSSSVGGSYTDMNLKGGLSVTDSVITDNTESSASQRRQNAFYKTNYTNDSAPSVIPTEMSIDMHRKNASRTKDPEVLLEFAKMMIKVVIMNKSDDAERTSKYLSEAHAALKRAAKGGSLEAQYLLGDAYSVGLFTHGKPDNRKSLIYFESAAKAKHIESSYRTAVCYRKGLGCTPDSRKVIKYMEMAAMKSHPIAMMEYGIYLFHGMMGLSNDITTKKKGISWLTRATESATENSCAAPYELAMIYLHGFKDIVIKDTTYAIRLLYQAANLGHSKSASLLGKYYEIGDIVDRNSDLSIHFYNMAAELGNPAGMMGLCSWYFVGSERLSKDYDEAFAWAERAAELKDRRAMMSVQRFYQLGIGCNKDEQRANYWAQMVKTNDEEASRKKAHKHRHKSGKSQTHIQFHN